MDSPKLTPKQAEAFDQKVGPMMGYLYRCERRRESKNFTERSKLVTLVKKARHPLHSLHIHLHYMSVGDGVGGAGNPVKPLTVLRSGVSFGSAGSRPPKSTSGRPPTQSGPFQHENIHGAGVFDPANY